MIHLKGRQVPTIEEQLKNVPQDKINLLFRSNFALWCQYSGIQVDGREFSFENRRYLLPIYLDDSKELVLLKAAQTGATVYMLLWLMWFARNNQVKVGLYLPNESLVKSLSKDRIGPVLESNRELSESVHDATDTLGLKRIKNVHGGTSSLYIMHLGGVSSKDSVPLDAAFFDEVRLVKAEDIDQAQERLSASKFKYKRFMSTSGGFSTTIHKRFMNGTQLFYQSRCNCPDWCNLAETFPDCIVERRGEVYYRCPRCKMKILDPQNGGYIARNPGAPYNSYQVSQLVANNLSPAEIWRFFNETTNKAEFYNSKLGLPYQDEEAMPINDAILDRCVDQNAQWAYKSLDKSELIKDGTVMGVDQMHGYAYAVIGRKTPEGTAQIIHYELIETGNPVYGDHSPFKRLYQLMSEYNVTMAVVDAQPGFGEASDMARAFPGRVFISYYTYGGQDMVKWNDRAREKATIRKGDKSIKLPFIVVINRYQIIDAVTREMQQGRIRYPNPDALVPMVKNEKSGKFEPENIFRTRFYKHLKSIERVREYNQDTGTEKLVWKEYIDPHSLHALVLMFVALGRARKSAKLINVE